MSDIICFSHLRWDFVWQRPQQLLSRLSGDERGRLLFVEEPVAPVAQGEPYLEILEGKGASNIQVVRLIYPVEKADWTDMLDAVTKTTWLGHGDPRTQAIYTRLLKDYLARHPFNSTPVVWFYTPMASDFSGIIPTSKSVYDVMDQLAAFKNAPPELLQREDQLLRQVDLVFTGGVSLYEAKKPYNPNTHLFPSGVDSAHFGRAANPANFPVPADIAALSQPILGYYGVIDERIDYDLLSQLATSHPEWNIVMVGPLAKIMPEDLPRIPNLHFVGGKTYQELPAYLAHFEVALVPFAISESTRYLSPTKTLEYMAAHKPIVSTAIKDVETLFGEVVRIGHTTREFINQVEIALAQSKSGEVTSTVRAKEEELLERYSWDSLAHEMQQLIG